MRRHRRVEAQEKEKGSTGKGKKLFPGRRVGQGRRDKKRDSSPFLHLPLVGMENMHLLA